MIRHRKNRRPQLKNHFYQKVKKTIKLILIITMLLSFISCELEPEPEYFTLTVTVTGHGITTPSVGQHKIDDHSLIEIEAVAESGWYFSHWEGPVERPESRVTQLFIESDTTITAVFVTAISSIQEFDNIDVAYGTDISDVFAFLPEQGDISDSAGNSYTVSISWELQNYDAYISQSYQAEGTFSLPLGVISNEQYQLPEINCLITVLPYAVSGFITEDGIGHPIEGVEVFFSDPYEFVTSDSDGQWQKIFYDKPVRITPLHPEFQFIPEYIDVLGPSESVDFIGTINPVVSELPELETIVKEYGTVIDDLATHFPTAATVQLDTLESIDVPIDWVWNPAYNGNQAGLWNFSGYLESVDVQGNPIFVPDNLREIIQTVYIEKGHAIITISGLEHIYTGEGKSVTVKTNPKGLNCNIYYNGLDALPVNAGEYEAVVTIEDDNYQGTASEILLIEKASAEILIEHTEHTYDGDPKSVLVKTQPSELPYTVLYDGSPNKPKNPGSYLVQVDITDKNHQATASSELQIHKGEAEIHISGLQQVFDGSKKEVSVSTVPSDISFTVTYGDKVTPPTHAGIWDVHVEINDPFYTGHLADTLIISKAEADISISNLVHVADGNPKSVTVSTVPEDIEYLVTYEGLMDKPTQPGSYTVNVEVIDPNYRGSAEAEMILQLKAESAASWAPVTILVGTDSDSLGELLEINYPTVTLTLSDNSVIDAPVFWDVRDTVSTIGTYTIYGDISPSELYHLPDEITACITVNAVDVTAIYKGQTHFLGYTYHDYYLVVHLPNIGAKKVQLVSEPKGVLPASLSVSSGIAEGEIKVGEGSDALTISLFTADSQIGNSIEVSLEKPQNQLEIDSFTKTRSVPLLPLITYDVTLIVYDPDIASIEMYGVFDDAKTVIPINEHISAYPIQLCINPLSFHSSEYKAIIDGIGAGGEVLFRTEVTHPFESNHIEFPVTLERMTFLQHVPLLPLVYYEAEFAVHSNSAAQIHFTGSYDTVDPESISLLGMEPGELRTVVFAIHLDEKEIVAEVLTSAGAKLQTIEIYDEIKHHPTENPVIITDLNYIGSVPLFPLRKYQISYQVNNAHAAWLVITGEKDSADPSSISIVDVVRGDFGTAEFTLHKDESSITIQVLSLAGEELQSITITHPFDEQTPAAPFTLTDISKIRKVPLFPLKTYSIGFIIEDPQIAYIELEGLVDNADPSYVQVFMGNLGEEKFIEVTVHEDENALQIRAYDYKGRELFAEQKSIP